mgnify:CR=1 FL=1
MERKEELADLMYKVLAKFFEPEDVVDVCLDVIEKVRGA